MAYITIDVATGHLTRLGQDALWRESPPPAQQAVLELASTRIDALSFKSDCGLKITPRFNDNVAGGGTTLERSPSEALATLISLLAVWYLENPNIQLSLVSGAVNGEEVSEVLSPDLVDLPFFVRAMLKDFLTPGSIQGEPDGPKGRAISYKFNDDTSKR